jgi:hypothetical protein
MMKRLVHTTLAAAVVLVWLTACGEKPQTGGGIRSDAPAHTGTGSNFMQSGWKAGDKAGWEAQLKARQQYGQNEYSRTQTK